MERMVGKRAVIYGADQITHGIARRFLAEGSMVTVIDEATALTDFDDLSDAAYVALERTDAEAVAEAMSRAIGSQALDVLVIGGGDIPDLDSCRLLMEIAADDLQRGAFSKVAGALSAAQAARGALEQAQGSLLFLFAPNGMYSEEGWSGRSVGHHAMRGLARTIAGEWGAHGIRANILVPLADTPAFQRYRARNAEIVDFRISKTALRRMGDPERDIGGAAVFLSSEDARYVTGSTIFADGGNFLGAPVVDSTLPQPTAELRPASA